MKISENSEPGTDVCVLVAEDEPMIAMDLEQTLDDMGVNVVGPFPTVSEACQWLDNNEPDVALLDVNLADGKVYPVADRLQTADVPLVFHSANVGEKELKRRYDDARVVAKPSSADAIRRAVRDAVAKLRDRKAA